MDLTSNYSEITHVKPFSYCKQLAYCQNFHIKHFHTRQQDEGEDHVS